MLRGILARRPFRGGARRGAATFWNDEWERIGLKINAAPPGASLDRLAFVQLGFGVDQHGERGEGGATRAAVRACRNAIEFNSIPGMVELVPGGRERMLVHVRLGVPPEVLDRAGGEAAIDLEEVAAVFPYGQLMQPEVVPGGLAYGSGRVVPELGDADDQAVCCVAAVSIGYDSGAGGGGGFAPRTWDTRDGH
mmetsp:Transcript_5987/g.17651  ORF Transcript_5987/g.17651 Transcript_5987/m.17651 type:complete len:194 (-) Transcript_5987:8-589(-)